MSSETSSTCSGFTKSTLMTVQGENFEKSDFFKILCGFMSLLFTFVLSILVCCDCYHLLKIVPVWFLVFVVCCLVFLVWCVRCPFNCTRFGGLLIDCCGCWWIDDCDERCLVVGQLMWLVVGHLFACLFAMVEGLGWLGAWGCSGGPLGCLDWSSASALRVPGRKPGWQFTAGSPSWRK